MRVEGLQGRPRTRAFVCIGHATAHVGSIREERRGEGVRIPVGLDDLRLE